LKKLKFFDIINIEKDFLEVIFLLFNESWIAGVVISIGAMAYLTIGGPVGALIFAVGLSAVIVCGMKLFTGRMVIETKWQTLLMIWVGNFMGCAVGALLSSGEVSELAYKVMKGKVALGGWSVFIRGVLCGTLMACATVPHICQWKDTVGRWILTIASVVAFIVIGADHCVADMYFWFTSGALLNMIWVPLVATIGNYVGGWLFKLGMYEKIG
jgi:formate transporter